MDNKLKLQRLAVNNFIIFCEAVLGQPEPNLSTGYLEAKSKLISELWSKLDSSHDVILMEIEEEDKVTQAYFVNKDHESAFKMYDKVSIKIQQKLEKYRGLNPQIPSITLPENLFLNAVTDKSNIKLKPIDIPTFTGDYKRWISFKNMFDSLIHNSEAFSKLQKIHYLKSCLSGEAERIISQFDITEDSYDPAYAAITDRFHNEVILVDTHIISILSQPDLTSESSHGLKELMDVTTENLRALKSLGIDTDTWDPILLLLLVQKLDTSTRRLWEQNLKPKTRPTIKQFLDFLATRFHALGCQQKFKFSMESSSTAIQQNNKKSFSFENRHHNSNNNKSKFQQQVFPPRVHQSFHNASRRSCPICSEENHSIFSCEMFRTAEQRARVDMVTCARLCQRCLRNHQSECTQREGCRVCGGNHHTFLHLDRQEDRDSLGTQARQTTQETNQPDVNNQSSVVVNSHHVSLQRTAPNSPSTPVVIINSHHVNTMTDVKSVGNNQIDCQVIPWDAPVLLATAIVLIRSVKDNIFYPFRCLLDQGGEASHISQSAARFLGLREKSISATMTGLGGVSMISSKGVVDFELGSKINQDFTFNAQALVVSKVTNPLPSTFVQRMDWKHIEGLRLADPEFYRPASIDIILGASVYGYLLLPGLIKGTPNSPVAQNTELGWILSGVTEPNSNPVNIFNNHLEIQSIEGKGQRKYKTQIVNQP